jgi:2-oxoglutarate dehydrogenase E1 component
MSESSLPFPAVSADFIIDLYHRYIRDPQSVDPGWQPYFNELYAAPADAIPASKPGIEAALARLIEAHRQRGHFAARLDPLGLWAPPMPADLSPAAQGIATASLDAALDLDGVLGLDRCTASDVVTRLSEAYCGSIGFDCAHVEDQAARQWLYSVAETGGLAPDRAARRAAAERVVEADALEQFMNRRFLGKKRFGAEGAESMVPWFDALLANSAELGVREVVIGGTARGRLNVMAHIVGKPLQAMFYELKGHRPFPADVQVAGDVPYHFGYAGERSYGGRSLRIHYCHNPSHLEAIDGVALGRVRARQERRETIEAGRREVLGLLVHTDAAFAGQGVVAEVLQLSRIPAYATGGTIHLVINNQLGFTTDPQHGRSSTFCTDVAKTVSAPVLHVNGDDVDAVVRAARIAAEFRHRFHSDIVVDLVCYRRRGHNEVDEPAFTQPLMYRKVAGHPELRQLYLDRLRTEGVISGEEVEGWTQRAFARLEAAYEAAKSYRPNRAGWLNGGDADGEHLVSPAAVEIGLPLDRLTELGLALSRVPDGIAVNPKIVRQLNEREQAIRSGRGISWALGEALALASLACERTPVRMSGQDTPRGAFSQRHFILVDQETGVAAEPFNLLGAGQAHCDIIGSPLSEYSVLGFEYGLSLDSPERLVIWEAQFGDFANVAQVIIDQFVASGQAKWLDRSGLVLLLPHGLEGQGPDHSSGRIERFLQLCAGDNLTLANCTTPANYFHLLRRQARAPERRPLVVFTPKSLLRHKHAVSDLSDFAAGTAFAPVIGAPPDTRAVRRVILCSGKIYYDLAAHLRESGIEDTAIVRIEQLYPFPAAELARELRRFPGASAVWCQEEPRNLGPWSYFDRRIEQVLHAIGNDCEWPCCISRPENASTAIGTTDEHNADQLAIVAAALEGDLTRLSL